MDLLTILAVIGTIAGIGSLVVDYLALRRTPKPPKPPVTGGSTLFLGANLYDDVPGLPGYDRRGRERIGFGRFGK